MLGRFGRFGRLSGRAGAYEAIRDRFPLVAKSKVGSVGDMAGVGEGRRVVQKTLIQRQADSGFWW